MKNIIILMICAIVAVSCKSSYEYDIPDCKYSARIVFHYNEENMSATDRLPDFATKVDAYVFDKQGVLRYYQQGISLNQQGVFEYKPMITPGDYSVIAFANRSAESILSGLNVGLTRREQIEMQLNKIVPTRGNADRLYYGYRTFTVHENNVTDTRVDMTHAHMLLRVSVSWKGLTPASRSYYMTMSNVPSHYGFMPEYVFDNNVAKTHNPLDDNYELSPSSIGHYVPKVSSSANILNHRIDMWMSSALELNGEFVTYRIRNTTHPLLNLYDADGARVMKADVDLWQYFSNNNIERDRNIRQEFNISILIDGENVTVSSVTIGDWDEGGNIK